MCIRDRAKGIPTGIYKETGVEVKGNMITGNGNGIRLYLADGCTVENNQLKLQKTASVANMGIYLSASSKNVIKDDQVSGCKNVGIYAYDGGKLGTPSTENQVLDNVISGIGGDGILMENGSDGCEVSRNRISLSLIHILQLETTMKACIWRRITQCMLQRNPVRTEFM